MQWEQSFFLMNLHMTSIRALFAVRANTKKQICFLIHNEVLALQPRFPIRTRPSAHLVRRIARRDEAAACMPQGETTQLDGVLGVQLGA